LNPRALDNALGIGLMYAALDQATQSAGPAADDRRRAAQDFFAFVGQFFESYALQFVQRIAERSGSFFHGEVHDDRGDRSSDGFVLENGALTFFEVRYGRVARPVIESLDAQKIEDAFENIIYAKCEQLDRNIRAFADNRLRIPGVDRNRIREVFPVLVLPSPFPRSPQIQEKIDRHLNSRGWFQGRIDDLQIMPLEIIEIEALEGMDSLHQPFIFSDLIRDKVRNASSRFTFFKNFLINTRGLRLRLDREREDEAMAFMRELSAETAGWIQP
jgi:hypothetical protein